MKPLCHSCGSFTGRRAKPLPSLRNWGCNEPFFCTIACAARAGVAELMGGAIEWDDEASEWRNG